MDAKGRCAKYQALKVRIPFRLPDRPNSILDTDRVWKASQSVNAGDQDVRNAAVRFKAYATSVHDPIYGGPNENYSHVEVRELYEGESVTSVPPKNRK